MTYKIVDENGDMVFEGFETRALAEERRVALREAAATDEDREAVERMTIERVG